MESIDSVCLTLELRLRPTWHKKETLAFNVKRAHAGDGLPLRDVRYLRRRYKNRFKISVSFVKKSFRVELLLASTLYPDRWTWASCKSRQVKRRLLHARPALGGCRRASVKRGGLARFVEQSERNNTPLRHVTDVEPFRPDDSRIWNVLYGEWRVENRGRKNRDKKKQKSSSRTVIIRSLRLVTKERAVLSSLCWACASSLRSDAPAVSRPHV